MNKLRPRREFALSPVALPINEYIPARTRDPQEAARRRAVALPGTHALVLENQAVGSRHALRTFEALRGNPDATREWATLFGAAALGSVYHLVEWNGENVSYRRYDLPELAKKDGSGFNDPEELHSQALTAFEAAAKKAEERAAEERAGNINSEKYVRLARQLAHPAFVLTLLPLQAYAEQADPVVVQQEAYDTISTAWGVALSLSREDAAGELPTLAQLADSDSSFRRFIRDPKFKVSDEVSGAVEAAGVN